MPISESDVPEDLKSDKSITVFLKRSVELANVEPVLSYYCKIFVLEYVLENKLHVKAKANEEFTIKLLDDTESIKNSTEDAELNEVLKNKDLSFGYVFKFVYNLFNSCLESLIGYEPSQKAQLVGKFRATLDFFKLFDVFKSSGDNLNYAKYTGDKIHSWDELDKGNKEKVKILKYQLTRLIKNEIPFVAKTSTNDNGNDDDAALEKELDDEITNIKADESLKGDDDLELNAEDDDGDDHVSARVVDEGEKSEKDAKSSDQKDVDLHLPGAPHFLPSEEPDDGAVKLPGTPKYLPDEDISHINKSGPIHYIQPQNEDTTSRRSEEKPSVSRNVSSHTNTTSNTPLPPQQQHQHHHQKPLSKENITQILNRDDAITRIQKHTKFANSALQFDDINEAEKQLRQGLELIQLLKKQDEN
ncbi:uncharacterized protein LODBEIA_P05260 [Lodderomyces beijingensis]|uniref:Vta1 C-terminal domain-containing protein n=1 Tax=Lodderomyces beijingensis TaxID=1775926 RepID=A0ABP0ZJE4_9ASCO